MCRNAYDNIKDNEVWVHQKQISYVQNISSLNILNIFY